MLPPPCLTAGALGIESLTFPCGLRAQYLSHLIIKQFSRRPLACPCRLLQISVKFDLLIFLGQHLQVSRGCKTHLSVDSEVIWYTDFEATYAIMQTNCLLGKLLLPDSDLTYNKTTYSKAAWLKSCMKQDWANILFSKIKDLVPLVLKDRVKRRGGGMETCLCLNTIENI